MVVYDADQTYSQMESVLDRLVSLRHVMFGSLTTHLLCSVASSLPALETLCAMAVYDRSTTEHRSVL